MARKRQTKGRRDAVLAVYMPAPLLAQLRAVADRERRTASTQALVYIERALDSTK